ncbi:MAG: hypothetical protein ACP5N7_07120 [Candidatus Pacearchaeota archaeon]
MSNQNKHHYRKVFKSDHLGSADLEDYIEQKRPLIFTIKQVRQEIGATVAGKKGNFNIAYFVEEGIKPLVLNATNSKVVKGFAGGSPFVEDWNNIKIELYIDENVKMKGEVVGGVRIKQVQPIDKVKPAFTVANFEKAHKAGATFEQIEKSYTITDEVKQQYIDYAKTN